LAKDNFTAFSIIFNLKITKRKIKDKEQFEGKKKKNVKSMLTFLFKEVL